MNNTFQVQLLSTHHVQDSILLFQQSTKKLFPQITEEDIRLSILRRQIIGCFNKNNRLVCFLKFTLRKKEQKVIVYEIHAAKHNKGSVKAILDFISTIFPKDTLIIQSENEEASEWLEEHAELKKHSSESDTSSATLD